MIVRHVLTGAAAAALVVFMTMYVASGFLTAVALAEAVSRTRTRRPRDP
jgi:hypothetical protein